MNADSMRRLASPVKMRHNRGMLLPLLLLLGAQEADSREGERKLVAGDLDGAIEWFTRAIVSDPKSAAAHAGRAEALRRKGDVKAALRDFDTAIGLGTQPSLTWLGRSICRFHLRDLYGALRDATSAIERDPRSARAFEIRAKIANVLPLPRQAILDATKALDLDPSNAGARLTRALAYLGFHAYRSALRDFGELAVLDPSTKHETRLWAWFARAQMGEEEDATRELKAWLSGPEGASRTPHDRALAGCLAGTTTEEALLERAAREDARYRCWVQTIVAFRRLAEGDKAGAEPFLRRAVALDLPPENPVHITARHEIDRRAWFRRRELLDVLEGRLREQKPFRAEFVPTGAAADPDRRTLKRLTVHLDLKARKALFVAKTESGDMFFHSDGLTLRSWRVAGGKPAGPARLTQLTSLMDESEAMTRRRRRIRALAPDPPPPRPLSWRVRLELEGAPGSGQQGNLGIGNGFGGRAATWFDELISARVVEESHTERSASFRTILPRKRFVIDRKTGFVREIEVWDHDGKPRGLRQSSFTPDSPFPDVRPPKAVVSVPPERDLLGASYRAQVSSLSNSLGAMFENWDHIPKENGGDRLRDLVIDWAAGYTDSWHSHLVRGAAREYLAVLLRRRVPLADLAPDKPGGRARFLAELRRRRADLHASLKGHVDAARTQLEDGLIRYPIDSALHAVMRKVLREAFEFDAVEKRRSRDDDAKVRKLYREAYDAARRI